jgi:hypothetical protein
MKQEKFPEKAICKIHLQFSICKKCRSAKIAGEYPSAKITGEMLSAKIPSKRQRIHIKPHTYNSCKKNNAPNARMLS